MDKNVKFVVDEIFKWFNKRHYGAGSVLTKGNLIDLTNPTPRWYPEQKAAIDEALEYLVENEYILYNQHDMLKYITLTNKGYNYMRENY